MDFQETIRSFATLGGQSAPRAGDRIGIKLLYRCNLCARIWLQDGQHVRLEVNDAQAHALAQEMSADLDHLPRSTCRLCLYRSGGGATEIDEYGKGAGFGVSWECPVPRLLHAIATITSLDWLQRTDPCQHLPDVVTRPNTLRAVLAWFVELRPTSQCRLLTSEMCRLLATTNPPGFGQPGTAHWRWCGVRAELPCPPLGGTALVILTMAMPRTEAFDLPTAFSVWQALALLTLSGGIAGETRPEPPR